MSTSTAIRQLSFPSNSSEKVGYSLAFLSETTPVREDFGKELGNDNLVFLFLNTSQEDLKKTIDQGLINEPFNLPLNERFERFLDQPMYRKVKFLWVENPLEPYTQWQAHTLSVEEKTTGVYQVSDLAYFDVRNYAFGISKGGKISFTGNDFLIERAADNPEGFEWSTAYGAHRMHGISNVVTLPITGAEIGCLEFDLFVEKVRGETHFGYPKLTQLDIGFRIFMSDPNFVEEGDDFYYESHRYPLFDEVCTNEAAFDFYPASLSFRVTLDPLNLFDQSRSFFKLDPADFNDANPTPQTTIASGYRTNVGRTIHLYPTATSKLVFSERLIDVREIDIAPLYLVPAGDFKIRVPDYKDTTNFPERNENIVCGVSGVEYMQIPKGTTGNFSFHPNKPGFAKSFISTAALLRELPMLIRRYANPKGILEELGTLKAQQTKADYLKNKSINDATLLNEIHLGYFSKNYVFTKNQLNNFGKVDTIGELIDWIWETLFDNADLDIAIDEINGKGLNISRTALRNHLQLDYFPVGFQFSTPQILEYLELNVLEDLIVWLWENLLAASSDSIVGGNNPLSDGPKTSWVYFWRADKKPVVYYAQPDASVLHQPDNTIASTVEFLKYLEIPTMGLPFEDKSMQASSSFPMLPYGEVDGEVLTDINQLETKLISNHRRKILQGILDAQTSVVLTKHADETKSNYEILTEHRAELPSLGTTEKDIEITGTTPQGLMTTISKDYLFWETLQLGLCLDSDDGNKRIPLSFTNIEQGSKLKSAFQSSQLFMVMTDPAAVRSYFSENNRMVIQGWGFILDPNNWAPKGAKSQTIFLFKFQEHPLIELAAHPERWSFPDEFNADKARTSKALVNMLQEAIDIKNGGDEAQKRKYAALARAATEASWTGILALNVHVPLNELPDDLLALAAGIDADKFYSHYIGIEMTPVEVAPTTQKLKAEESSLFGLIDYKNAGTPLVNSAGYDFHVRLLTVLFENSRITDFAAEILIVMNSLFDEPTKLLDSPSGRNLIVLKGTAQRHDDKITYAFGFNGANRFQLLDSETISEVEIVRAQFATDPIPPVENEVLKISGRFTFWGILRFHFRPEFDALSFGPDPYMVDESKKLENDKKGLPFNNLQVIMEIDLKTTEVVVDDVTRTERKIIRRDFTFDPNQLAFDLKQVGVRTNSLYSKFPLKLTTFRYVKADENALKESGFMPVKSPIKGNLGATWYGFTYELNLGSVGALAGKAGIVVSILIAWSPSTDETGEGMFIGLKLPGSVGGKREITIQGIFKIVFKTIQFVVYPLKGAANDSQVGYLLKIKHITMKFFVLSLPPNGQTEIILFGDPREGVVREDQLLGWYAAYAKK